MLYPSAVERFRVEALYKSTLPLPLALLDFGHNPDHNADTGIFKGIYLLRDVGIAELCLCGEPSSLGRDLPYLIVCLLVCLSVCLIILVHSCQPVCQPQYG